MEVRAVTGGIWQRLESGGKKFSLQQLLYSTVATSGSCFTSVLYDMLDISRVVSLEISHGKFPENSGNLY